MEMGRRVLLLVGKHLFDQKWGGLSDLPRNDKKLWLIEVKSERKFGKRIGYIETSGGQIYMQQQRVHGAPITDVNQVLIFRTPL